MLCSPITTSTKFNVEANDNNSALPRLHLFRCTFASKRQRCYALLPISYTGFNFLTEPAVVIVRCRFSRLNFNLKTWQLRRNSWRKLYANHKAAFQKALPLLCASSFYRNQTEFARLPASLSTTPRAGRAYLQLCVEPRNVPPAAVGVSVGYVPAAGAVFGSVGRRCPCRAAVTPDLCRRQRLRVGRRPVLEEARLRLCAAASAAG